MWLRQAQIFQLTPGSFRTLADTLSERLALLAFTPCLPATPFSLGWVPPSGGEEGRLFRRINDCIMICMEIEEKILPSSVVKQYLDEKIRKIETTENRKVYAKEKLTLKDEMTVTLLPRAFGRRQRIYGYIDVRRQWLVIGTGSPKRAEQFITLFKKTLSEEVAPFRIDGLSDRMAGWLRQGECAAPFLIGDACIMQDKAQQGRVIRCRQQDLMQEGVQLLLNSGCAVRQLSMEWQGQVVFSLVDPFLLQGIRFADEVVARSREMEPETAEQQFDADFFIFSSLLGEMLEGLLGLVRIEKINDKISEVA